MGKISSNTAIEKEKKEVIAAWRTLYYIGLLSDKEKESIAKKIKKKYKIAD